MLLSALSAARALAPRAAAARGARARLAAALAEPAAAAEPAKWNATFTLPGPCKFESKFCIEPYGNEVAAAAEVVASVKRSGLL